MIMIYELRCGGVATCKVLRVQGNEWLGVSKRQVTVLANSLTENTKIRPFRRSFD